MIFQHLSRPSFLLQPLTDFTFKQASWDWVQDATTAATKWGDIGVWNVSGVKR
jgi:hypothetical protein